MQKELVNGNYIIRYSLRTKSILRSIFLVLQLVTNRGQVSVPGRTNQYLEGPISTWKDHEGNIGVKLDSSWSLLVLPGTDTSPLFVTG